MTREDKNGNYIHDYIFSLDKFSVVIYYKDMESNTMTNETTITLSAPAKSGYKAEFESTDEARIAAAGLLDITVEDMVEVESGDGSTTYCYASQSDADADQDGAYAVQYSSAS